MVRRSPAPMPRRGECHTHRVSDQLPVFHNTAVTGDLFFPSSRSLHPWLCALKIGTCNFFKGMRKFVSKFNLQAHRQRAHCGLNRTEWSLQDAVVITGCSSLGRMQWS